jgi:hypothetical protein
MRSVCRQFYLHRTGTPILVLRSCLAGRVIPGLHTRLEGQFRLIMKQFDSLITSTGRELSQGLSRMACFLLIKLIIKLLT